jgi:hypothetical protein
MNASTSYFGNRAHRASDFIKRLRIENFRKGYHFLIYDTSLPSGQTYVEYPDGRINIEYLIDSTNHFEIVQQLDQKQADAIRIKYGLSSVSC